MGTPKIIKVFRYFKEKFVGSLVLALLMSLGFSMVLWVIFKINRWIGEDPNDPDGVPDWLLSWGPPTLGILIFVLVLGVSFFSYMKDDEDETES